MAFEEDETQEQLSDVEEMFDVRQAVEGENTGESNPKDPEGEDEEESGYCAKYFGDGSTFETVMNYILLPSSLVRVYVRGWVCVGGRERKVAHR